ncbi:MAG: phosphohistidine phosphatase SixA [Nitrospira sp.]|nr:phosphohistidine phosphatase SixA [bacterium]MBL7048887.1 phosphohistidine phosphatase SixA [Nitrospira sp.]
MRLYLVQHAASRSKEIDATQSLSNGGVSDLEKIGGFLKGLKIEVRQIGHSGKMRSLQTAQMLAEHITSDMGILEVDGLLPMDDPCVWAERACKLNQDEMLVGHLPHMAKMAALLVSGNKEKDVIEFANGCVVCLKTEDRINWCVDWILKPWMVQ